MCCFKDRMASQVVDVCTWSDTDTAYLCSQSVRYVVTVQVEGCYYIVLSWTSQDLLQERVSNHVFYDDFASCFSISLCFVCSF